MQGREDTQGPRGVRVRVGEGRSERIEQSGDLGAGDEEEQAGQAGYHRGPVRSLAIHSSSLSSV